VELDYVEVAGGRLCAAVWIGATRLIDNERGLGLRRISARRQIRRETSSRPQRMEPPPPLQRAPGIEVPLTHETRFHEKRAWTFSKPPRRIAARSRCVEALDRIGQRGRRVLFRPEVEADLITFASMKLPLMPTHGSPPRLRFSTTSPTGLHTPGWMKRRRP